jgi:hypothetical protein
MAKGNSKGSRISAEERLLEKQRDDLMRRAQELEKKLKHIPLVMERQEQQQREATKRRALDAGPSISPYMGRRSRSRKSKSFRMPSRERYFAKIQTVALLVVFAIIVFMLFKVLPTGQP